MPAIATWLATFRDLPAADRTDPRHLGADDLQHRLRASEVLLGAAAHDGECTPDRALGSAGHRGVDVADALRAELFGQASRRGRGDGGAIDDQPALPQAVNGAGAALEQHVLDIGSVGHATQDDVHLVGGRRGALGARRTQLGERFLPHARPVVDRDLAAGLDQVGRHRRAHRSQAEHGDLHYVLLPSVVGAEETRACTIPPPGLRAVGHERDELLPVAKRRGVDRFDFAESDGL